MTSERSDITNFHHRLESDVLLNPKREVVDRWRMRIHLHSVEIGRPRQSSADQTLDLIDVPEINAERAISGLIVDEVSARGTTANTRRMINARLETKYRFA